MVKMEDMKGVKRKEWWSNLDVLAAVVKVASKKFKKKKRKQKKKMIMEEQSSHPNASSSSSNYSQHHHHQITKIKIRFSSENSTDQRRPPITNSCSTSLLDELQQNPIKKKPLFLLDHHHHIQRKPNIKRKKAAASSTGPDLPPPNMPLEFQEMITRKGGSEVGLVIQKSLFKTDLSKTHNRLSIPLNRILKKDFITKEEDGFLKLHNGKSYKGIKCLLIEPSMEETSIVLKKWEMKKKSGKSSFSYVLVTQWNGVVIRNHLEEEMIVQLWSFRLNSNLCFALVKLL